MMVELIDFQPRGVPDGDLYTFKVDGRTIVIESWATDSSSGLEVHDKDTGSFADLSDFGTEKAQRIHEVMTRIDELWQSAWIESIYPIHERERARVITQVKAEE